MSSALNVVESVIEMPIGVLLLDDNPADIARVTRLLECDQAGSYQIHPFYDSKSSLSFLEQNQNQFHVCLVDFSLHNETAFDFLRQLNNKAIKPLPVIVMTGQSIPGIDEQLMRTGVHDFWDKRQLNTETLARCIRFARYRHTEFLLKNRESESKTRYLAHINHELKTPLNAIIGFSRILKKMFSRLENLAQNDQQKASRCFSSINESCQKLIGLIEDLLDYSAIELGHLSIHKNRINISEVLRQVVEDHRYSADEASLNLSLDMPHGDYFIRGDANRLRQAIGNFISNAIKYTEQGSVSILVDEEKNLDTHYLVIRVKDTGIGIARERLSDLFNEFTQLHAQSKPRFESSGLGLVIAKHLIELHQGYVAVMSKLGQGSCFVITLPLVDRPG